MEDEVRWIDPYRVVTGFDVDAGAYFLTLYEVGHFNEEGDAVPSYAGHREEPFDDQEIRRIVSMLSGVTPPPPPDAIRVQANPEETFDLSELDDFGPLDLPEDESSP